MLNRSNILIIGLILMIIVAATGDGYFFLVNDTNHTTSSVNASKNTNGATSTLIEIQLSSVMLTRTVTESITTTTPIYLPCTTSSADGLTGATLSIPEGGTATICVEFFYYNFTAPFYLDPTYLLSIEAANPTGFVDTSYNFTISVSSPTALYVGGNSNANEGYLVDYYITPNANVTGQFELAIAQNNYYPGQPYETLIDYQSCSPFVLSVGQQQQVTDYNFSCTQSEIYPGESGLATLPQGVLYALVVGYS